MTFGKNEVEGESSTLKAALGKKSANTRPQSISLRKMGDPGIKPRIQVHREKQTSMQGAQML